MPDVELVNFEDWVRPEILNQPRLLNFVHFNCFVEYMQVRRLDGPCHFGDDPNEELMFMNFVENYGHIKEQLAKDPDFRDKAREIVPGKMVVIPKKDEKPQEVTKQSLEEELSAMLEQEVGKDLRGSPLVPGILSILQRANTVDLPGNLQHASPGTATSTAAPPLAIRNTSAPHATKPAGPAADRALTIPNTSAPDAAKPATPAANLAIPSTSAPDAAKNQALAIPSTSAPEATKPANLALAMPSTVPHATKPANLAVAIPSTSVPADAASSGSSANRNPGPADTTAPEPTSEVPAVPNNVKPQVEVDDEMQEALNSTQGSR